jgi:hypothetical protein
VEVGREHAHHGGRRAVHLHRAPHHAAVAAEGAAPERVPEQRHARRPHRVLAGGEASPRDRRHAEHVEEVGGDLGRGEHHRPVAVGEGGAGRVVAGDRGEGAAPAAEVEEVGVRRLHAPRAGRLRRAVPEVHEPLRLGEGEGAEERGVDDAEHRRVGADAERDRRDHGRGEARPREEPARGVSQVAPERGEGPVAPVAAREESDHPSTRWESSDGQRPRAEGLNGPRARLPLVRCGAEIASRARKHGHLALRRSRRDTARENCIKRKKR